MPNDKFFSTYENISEPSNPNISITSPLPNFLSDPVNALVSTERNTQNGNTRASNNSSDNIPQYNRADNASDGNSAYEGLMMDIPWNKPEYTGKPAKPIRGNNQVGKLKFYDKIEEAYDTLIKWGYTAAIAAGILGNAWQESGFNINAIGDSGKARGWFQMHAPERENYKKWKEANKAKLKNLPEHVTQSLYVADAITNRKREYGIKTDVFQLTNPADVATLVSDKYERPSIKYANNHNRRLFAAQIHDYFNPVPAKFGTKLEWRPS